MKDNVYLPAWILATVVDCWSQMEVIGRFSFLSYSPCLKNSSHTFKLHLWDISHGRVGFDISAHLSAICKMKSLFSLLVRSKVPLSKWFWNKIKYVHVLGKYVFLKFLFIAIDYSRTVKFIVKPDIKRL